MFLSGSTPVPGIVPGLNMPSSGLQALFSTAQQISWSGSCLRVKRSSDNTQLDIGFVNGYMDMAAAVAFAAGSNLTVIKIYDQSGNGNDLVNSGGAPTLSSSTAWFGYQPVTFSSVVMALPAGLSMNLRSQTIFSVSNIQAYSVLQSLYEINTVYTGGVVVQKTAGNTAQGDNRVGDTLLDQPTGFRDTGVIGTSQPEVTVMTGAAGSRTYQINETLVTGLPAPLAATALGGFWGGAPDQGYISFNQFYLFAIYSTTMTQPAIQSAKNNIYTTFGINVSSLPRILWDGDSITEGTGSSFLVNNPFQAEPLLKDRVVMRNVGAFGEQLSLMLSNVSINVTPWFKPGVVNIDVISGGSNDLAASVTGANLYNNSLLPYVVAAKAAGYTVIVGTVIYRASLTAPQEAERVTYNGLVRSGAVANGYTIADYDGIVQLQNPQVAGYSSDGTHPTTLGYGLMAQVAATAINLQLP